MSQAIRLLTALREDMDNLYWPSVVEGRTPSPALEAIAAEADDETVEALLGLMTEPRSDSDVRQPVLLALGRRGTPAAIEAVGAYEEWAAARGVHLRPAWPLVDEYRAQGVTQDRAGRTWALFEWAAWAREHDWWLTWSDDGETWAPAGRLGWLDSPAGLLDELAEQGAARLATLNLATDETMLLDQLLGCLAHSQCCMDRTGPSPADTPCRRRSPTTDEAAIAQAVWLVTQACSNSRRPMLVPQDSQLSGVHLRGAVHPVLWTRSTIHGWHNLLMRRLGHDEPDRARREYRIWWGAMGARGYEVALQRRHDRWVVVEYALKWLS